MKNNTLRNRKQERMLAKIGFCFNYLHISLHNYHVIGSEFQISLHKYIFGIFVLKYDWVRLYDTMHAGFSLIFNLFMCLVVMSHPYKKNIIIILFYFLLEKYCSIINCMHP